MGVLPEPERGNERRPGARGADRLAGSICSDMLIGTSVSPLSPAGDLTLPGAQFGASPEGRNLFVFFPLALEDPEALQFLPVTVTSGP